MRMTTGLGLPKRPFCQTVFAIFMLTINKQIFREFLIGPCGNVSSDVAAALVRVGMPDIT